MYQWFVFIHLAGVFALLASHGASVVLAFRLRTEREPQRVEAMLELSGASIRAFYVSLGVLLVGGIGATFDGDLWGYGWIWASIAILVFMILAMYFIARPYYHRVRFVVGAMTQGSQAVTTEQFDALLRSSRPLTIIGIGFGGLALILYLMLFKPSLGMTPGSPGVAESQRAVDVRIAATELTFSPAHIIGPAFEEFVLAFDNPTSVPHNISIYNDEYEILNGEVFTGPNEVTYEMPRLAAGLYDIVCDVHPEMTGALEIR